MLSVQFDPTLSLSFIRMRHADLVAEVHQQHLIRQAMDYAASRRRLPMPAARGGVSRRTGRVLASVWRTMSFAAVRP
jgi:hypothetical protein